MKTIDIRNQPKLGIRRTATLTIHGIRYRLFRSLVTVMVITVAVAFLLNIVGESLIKRALNQRVEARLTELRQAALWASRLSTAKAPAEVIADLAAASPNAPRYRELQQMAAWSDDQMTQFHAEARQVQIMLDFFADLGYDVRRRLLHRAEGLQAFDQLSTAEGWQRFATELATIKSIRLPIAESELLALIEKWESFEARLNELHAAQAAAVAALAKEMGSQTLARLSTLDAPLLARIHHAGFLLPPEEAEQIAANARDRLFTQFLERTLIDGELRMRQPIAARRNMLPRDVSAQELWAVLSDTTGAQWFLEQLRERLDAATSGTAIQRERIAALDAEWMVRLAKLHHEEMALLRAQRMVTFDQGGLFGLGERLSWLVLVSLIVCTVGIANAMLMSVTERFREIATLKCLGALDGFIMLMFVFEACALGLIGGTVGALVGALVATLRMLTSFGSLTAGSLPVLELFMAIVIATIIGVILAAVAAVYPSYKAARLAPMEAMRIE